MCSARIKIIVLLLIFALVGCREEILHNLSEGEANKLLTKLHDANFEVSKKKEGTGDWSIAVESKQSLDAIRYLRDSRMFHESPTQERESSGIIASREEERFRFERALSREIEGTLGAIEGVLEAKVHLNLPPIDPVFGQPLEKGTKGSGSVLIVSRGDGIVADQISSLVAGASGVPKEGISVLVTKAAAVHHEESILPIAVEKPSGAFNTAIGKQNRGLIEFAAIVFVVGIALVGVSIVRFRRRRGVYASSILSGAYESL